MNNIELHIFTNSTEIITTKQTIFETFKSFVHTFGYIKPTIWVDPNPNNDPAIVSNYVDSIKTNIDCNLKFSKSLSDGYITAVESCKTPFAFMLEHDWIFKNNISHTLEEICSSIMDKKISHLRFNRIANNQSNANKSYNSYKQIKINEMEICLTQSASNNPHILYLPTYSRVCLPRIQKEHLSYGIEQRLENVDLGFAIYGGLNYPSTIIHTNGRDNRLFNTTNENMKEFPIESQTLDSDKAVLLTIRNLLGSAYSYLEIGSYLGGSLTPFLQDSNCVKILSIDDRGRQQPDERGARYDYGGITHNTMIQNLHSHGFDTAKLEVFNGSVDQYTGSDTYDFIFIDGEHTDWACFRDFVHAEKFLKKDCIVAFHDTQLIYKAIKIINELLRSRQDCVKFVKIKHSGMSCLFFNKFSEVDVENLFLVEQDLEKFYATCEEELLLQAAQNRVKITDHGYAIKPIPVLGL